MSCGEGEASPTRGCSAVKKKVYKCIKRNVSLRIKGGLKFIRSTSLRIIFVPGSRNRKFNLFVLLC
jgi:hypothetical protein